jgi:hypothetical protein
VCPVCNKVALSRSRECILLFPPSPLKGRGKGLFLYNSAILIIIKKNTFLNFDEKKYIMGVKSIDEERLEAINKMLLEGITEYTSIPPSSLSQSSCLTVSTSTAVWHGKSVCSPLFSLSSPLFSSLLPLSLPSILP